jgi:arsenical pump membrane protein
MAGSARICSALYILFASEQRIHGDELMGLNGQIGLMMRERVPVGPGGGLPAYLAGEAAVAAGNHVQLLGLLIGVNVGPVITPWASLATLLWFERCLSSGVKVPLLRYTLASACLAVIGIASATAALLLT